MITEDYVSLEVAKLLKEKGFSELVHYEYHYTISVPQFHKKAHNFNGEEYANCETEWFSTPTLQMVCKWLREMHNIFIIVEPYSNTSCYFSLWEGNDIYRHNPLRKDFSSYEETVEEALKYALENLI